MTDTEIIQQLWFCLSQGYTYAEAQIHIKAFEEGRTTVRRVTVTDREEV